MIKSHLTNLLCCSSIVWHELILSIRESSINSALKKINYLQWDLPFVAVKSMTMSTISTLSIERILTFLWRCRYVIVTLIFLSLSIKYPICCDLSLSDSNTVLKLTRNSWCSSQKIKSLRESICSYWNTSRFCFLEHLILITPDFPLWHRIIFLNSYSMHKSSISIILCRLQIMQSNLEFNYRCFIAQKCPFSNCNRLTFLEGGCVNFKFRLESWISITLLTHSQKWHFHI